MPRKPLEDYKCRGMKSLISVRARFVLCLAAPVAERSRDPGGNSHNGHGKTLHPVIPDTEDRSGDADRCNHVSGAIPQWRSDATKSRFALLVIDRIASFAYGAQLGFEFCSGNDRLWRITQQLPAAQKLVDVI